MVRAARQDAALRPRIAAGSLERMPTLVRDPQPAEFEALLERRHRLGQDLMDEVWDGVYVMNPTPAGRHAEVVQQLAEILGALARAAGLVPMVSIFNLGEPDDYRVPDGGLLRGRPGGEHRPINRSALIELGPAELAERLDWPE